MLMFTTIFSYQRHMSRWQGAHALPHLWQNFKKAGCHQYFLIRIYSTRTITRRRSQGPAPGLSLSIILTLLSMCGTNISQGMTPVHIYNVQIILETGIVFGFLLNW
jgi:hypothetical protein